MLSILFITTLIGLRQTFKKKGIAFINSVIEQWFSFFFSGGHFYVGNAEEKKQHFFSWFDGENRRREEEVFQNIPICAHTRLFLFYSPTRHFNRVTRGFYYFGPFQKSPQ